MSCHPKDSRPCSRAKFLVQGLDFQFLRPRSGHLRLTENGDFGTERERERGEREREGKRREGARSSEGG